jgi:hypothetical protein
MTYVGLLGVQRRERVEVAVGYAVDQLQEDLFGSHDVPHLNEVVTPNIWSLNFVYNPGAVRGVS